MPDRALTLLRDLLNKGQVTHDRRRDITLPATRIEGYPFEDAETSKAFHATLILAQRAGAINIEWRRHYENEELLRIRLLHANKLAAFLKTDYLPDKLDSIFSRLDLSGTPAWLNESVDHLRDQWIKGKTAFGLSVEDADKLPDIIKAVSLLKEGLPQTEPLDYRQFGARYLGNSKRTKEIAHALAALYQQHWSLSGWRDQDILAQLNLIILHHPILIRGPVMLSDGEQQLRADIYPCIGVPVKLFAHVEFIKTPTYVLSIENLSSFNEYTRSIRDDGLIFYTGGFPDSALQNAYQKLVGSDAPVFHWGDTDPHGFMILKTLQNNIAPHTVQPHLMDLPDGQSYTPSQIKSLQKLKPVNAPVDALLDELIVRGYGCVEQETVQARAPV